MVLIIWIISVRGREKSRAVFLDRNTNANAFSIQPHIRSLDFYGCSFSQP